MKAGVPLDRVNPVFITHHHFDHIGDLYDVMLDSWMHGRKGALQIYGPPETRRIVDALLTQVYDKDWQWRSMGEPSFGGWKPIVATDIEAGPWSNGAWKVPPIRVHHGDGLGFPPAFLQRWMCYGYRFEAEGKVVAISGDTVDCDGLDASPKGPMCSCTAATWRARRSRTSTFAAWCSTRLPPAIQWARSPPAPRPRRWCLRTIGRAATSHPEAGRGGRPRLLGPYRGRRGPHRNRGVTLRPAPAALSLSKGGL